MVSPLPQKPVPAEVDRPAAWYAPLSEPSAAALPTRYVALFLHGFEMGGAQRMTLTIAGSLARAGHRVDLVVATEAGPLRPSVPPGVRVVALMASDLPWQRLPRRHRVRAAMPALAAYIRNRTPDIIVGGANHVAIALTIAHRLAGNPLTRLVLRSTNPIGRRGGSWLKRRFARLLLPTADAIIAVSAPIAADHAGALGPHARIRVIPEPVLDEAFERRLAAPPFHPWLITDSPLVVTVGRLVAQKNHATLLTAFSHVAAAHPTVRLLIIGDGPLQGELATQVQALGLADRVAFAGEVRNPLPALRFARCFVLPSRWEGLGIVAIEAAAAGCRIVATDTPAVRWALDDGRLGRLVPPGDPNAMAQAIFATLSTDALRTTGDMHLAAFGEAAVAARYAELINDVCGGAG